MPKKKEQAKASNPDSLVKPTRKSSVELTEQELEKIAGGIRKAGKGPME